MKLFIVKLFLLLSTYYLYSMLLFTYLLVFPHAALYQTQSDLRIFSISF